MMETLSQWGTDALDTYGPRVMGGTTTLVLGWLAAKVLRVGLRRALRNAGSIRRPLLFASIYSMLQC